MQISILEYLENGAARQHPDKPAIVDGARSFTFAELERYAQRCATLLIRRIDFTCRPIAVFLPKSASAVFADLGIVYSGNIYANLDIKSPPQRVQGILGNIAPVLVITPRSLAAQLAAIGVPDSVLFFIEDIEDDGAEPDSAALMA
jgi:D-alanine--poly(phosphoribitol) ligase subunit 1